MRRMLCLLSAVLVPALATAQRPSPFVGSWRLVAFEQPDSTGHMRPNWGPKPIGLIIYQPDGFMSANGYDERRPSLETRTQQSGVDAARSQAFGGMFAYFGTYDVDTLKRQVRHHVQGAWISDWIGHDLVRSYRFIDRDHLELRIVSGVDGKVVANGGMLTWERVRR